MLKFKILAIIWIVIVIIFEGQAIAAFVKHNAAMVTYLQYVNAVHQVSVKQAIQLVREDVETYPHLWLSHMRLASLLTEAGKFDLAHAHAIKAFSQYGVDLCDQQGNWIRRISRPPQYLPDVMLDFADPQAIWNFHQTSPMLGSLSYTLLPNRITCAALIKVELDLSPNRFISLSQQIKVQPDQTYLLTGWTHAEGIQRAWMGIDSQWNGTGIENSTDWQPVKFLFHTSPTQTDEIIQFIIESGHGTVGIHSVKLEPINP